MERPVDLTALEIERVDSVLDAGRDLLARNVFSGRADRCVHMRIVRRDAPVDAAAGTARAQIGAPDDLPAVGVHRPDRSGLLTTENHVAARSRSGDDGRCAEINVAIDRLHFGNAVEARRALPGCAGGRATADVDVIRRRLMRPANLPVGQTNRHQRIRVGVSRGRCRLSCSDIELAALQIDGWRIPDRRAGRTPEHLAIAAILERLCVFHRVGFPHALARHGVQRHDAAVRLAAQVGIVTRHHDFVLRDRSNDLVPDKHGRSGCDRSGEQGNRSGPDFRARLGVDHVDLRTDVADQNDLTAIGANTIAGAGAQGLVAFVNPLNAGLLTVRNVERKQPVLVFPRRQEQRVADNRGLRAHGNRLRKSNRPGKFQLVEILVLQSRLRV